jgi:hypothetical protein
VGERVAVRVGSGVSVALGTGVYVAVRAAGAGSVIVALAGRSSGGAGCETSGVCTGPGALLHAANTSAKNRMLRCQIMDFFIFQLPTQSYRSNEIKIVFSTQA